MILTFDGKAIADFQGLVDLIKEHRPGDTVPLTVERRIDGKKMTVALSVKLDSWEAASRVPPASIKKPVPAKPIRKK
jgi:PDZ domain-containing secreted protein